MALYVGIKKQDLKKEENEESSFIEVTALNTEDITGISFYIGDEQVSFCKKGCNMADGGRGGFSVG